MKRWPGAGLSLLKKVTMVTRIVNNAAKHITKWKGDQGPVSLSLKKGDYGDQDRK